MAVIYLFLFMCLSACWYLRKQTLLLSTQDSMLRFLGGKTHRLFQLPLYLQEELDTLSLVLPNRHFKLLFVAREVVQDASDIVTHFCNQGLSQSAAVVAAESLKQWFDHCCRLAGMPAGILKLHTSTTPGPRWHTDFNLSWLHKLGQGQPQFKFGYTMRGDGTLLLDLHPMMNRIFQWSEISIGSIEMSNAFALFGHVHACPPGSMVAWSVVHGGNARGLRQVHSEAVSNKTCDGKNRVFVQVLPCTVENARSFKKSI
jgi:hypothetical protein